MANTAVVRSQAVLTTPPAGMRPLDIENEVLNVRPALTTVLTVLLSLNKIAVDSRVFKVNEQNIDAGTITLTGLAGNVLTVSTDDVKFVRIGQTIRLSATVVTRVSGTVDYAAGTFTVADSTGFTNGDVVLLGSTGSEELSGRPTAISRIPVQIENFVETQRDAFGQSRFVETEKHYGGPRQVHNKEIALWEHKRFIDRGLWYSTKEETTQAGANGTQKLYKTNGILASISTNIRAFGSSQITWAKMRHNITTDTRFSLSPNLWLFVSRLGSELLDTVAYNKTVPITYETSIGVKVGNWAMGNKTLKVMVVDHFENTAMGGTMVLIDPEMIEIVTCRNQVTGKRQFMIEKTFDGNDTVGTDGTIGEYISDFGLRLHNEQSHSIWTGALAIGS